MDIVCIFLGFNSHIYIFANITVHICTHIHIVYSHTCVENTRLPNNQHKSSAFELIFFCDFVSNVFIYFFHSESIVIHLVDNRVLRRMCSRSQSWCVFLFIGRQQFSLGFIIFMQLKPLLFYSWIYYVLRIVYRLNCAAAPIVYPMNDNITIDTPSTDDFYCYWRCCSFCITKESETIYYKRTYTQQSRALCLPNEMVRCGMQIQYIIMN